MLFEQGALDFHFPIVLMQLTAREVQEKVLPSQHFLRMRMNYAIFNQIIMGYEFCTGGGYTGTNVTIWDTVLNFTPS